MRSRKPFLGAIFLIPLMIGSLQVVSGQAGEGAADLARGRIIFENTCAECHDGYSKDTVIGPGLKGIREGKLPDGTKASPERLLDLINRGPAEMPSFKDRLTEQQKADVVAFVMTL